MLRGLPHLREITLHTGLLYASIVKLGLVFNTLTEVPSLSAIRSLSLAHEPRVRAYFEELHTPKHLQDMVTFTRSPLDDLL